MRIVFVGEDPARLISVPGGAVLCEHGVPVEVPDDLARSLLEQSVFEAAPAAKKVSE